MRKLVTPFRVGLLAIASMVALFIFLTFIRKGGMSDKEAIHTFAYFKDASGLGKKSRVQIAGIQVGEIAEIALDGARAKVILKVRRDVGLKTDASIRKRSESLLGDYMLDLYAGSERAEPMPENGEIVHVIDQQGMEAIFDSLGKITQDIQSVTGSLRHVLGGDKGTDSLERIVNNMVRLSDQVDATVRQSSVQLNEILKNFQGVSSDVRGITQSQQDAVKDIISDVHQITADSRQVAATIKKIIGSGDEGELKNSVASFKQTLARLDNTLANLEQVTNKIKEGKGAVGTLLSDERVGQKISETVEDVSDFASRFTRLQTEVGIRSEYLLYQGSAKNTLALRLIPKPDKYYLLEFVDDPRGQVTTQIVQTNPPSTGQPATQIQRITSERLKITAQFAKRYYFLTLRFGVTESTGGVGADLHFLNDALSLKLDAFNFSVEELRYPRVRAGLRLQAFEHLFATAGMDDLLNTQVRDVTSNRLLAGRDLFFGAGVFFTDDDLKAILPVAPVPRP